MTHQKILALMDGCSSASPMPFATLAMKSGLLPDTLRTVLDQMIGASPSPINRATLTKGDKTQELYWPTGVVPHRSGPQGIVINPAKRPPYIGRQEQAPAAKVQPNTSIPQKETSMNTNTGTSGHKQPSELRQALYNKIVAHPGIKRDALIKHALQQCPKATEKQALKALSNLQHMAKKIRLEGERGNYTYHLNTGVIQPPAKPRQPAKPVKKPSVGKVVLGKEAAALRGEPARKPRRVAKVAKVSDSTPEKRTRTPHAKCVDPAFSVMLSDDDQLHIVSGDDQVILNQERIDRLHRFLTRIQPAQGARA